MRSLTSHNLKKIGKIIKLFVHISKSIAPHFTPLLVKFYQSAQENSAKLLVAVQTICYHTNISS